MKSRIQCITSITIFFFTVWHLSAQQVGSAQEARIDALSDGSLFASDTNRTEYAGLYAHYVLGGFSTRLADYPNVLPSGVLTPQRSSVRSLAFGLATDSPVRLPFLTRRQNNEWFKGLRFGMQIEAQLTDISIVETSDSVLLASVVRTGTIQRSLFANLRSFAMIPSLRYSFASGLTLQGGVRLGLTNSSNIRLTDSILPSATNPNGEMLRILDNAPIPDIRADELSIFAGIGYTFRPDKTLQLRPELIANIPIAYEADKSLWRRGLPSLRISMNVMFNTAKVVPMPDTVYQRDTTIALVAYTQKPLLTLLTRNVEVRPAEYPEEPPTVMISESYKRDVPKPKPLLTARIDAEFALVGNISAAPTQFRRSVVLQAEKTAITLTPLCINATNASVYAEVLQEYFAKQLIRLTSLQTSTTTILLDTTILVGALPHIRFTPRVVSELPLRGTLLRIFRQSAKAERHAERRLLTTFADSSVTGDLREAMPMLWNPARMPDVLMNPNERLFYVFSVIDELGLEIPADSGAINLRTEPITGNLGLKRVIEIYAFEPDLALADFMRSLVAITITNAERVNIVPPTDSINTSETALRLQLLERTLPKAERTTLTFLQKPHQSSLPTAQQPNIVPSTIEERDERMRSILSRMMLVFVERRL